ncbi:uncharacterized protein LOC134314653 [Trichomycterus rosablanca]|uniref:uncharacterized protein LOC134314653 n=1 Tax=Trichomycterus rosablanca TaxID=2290929 RepID=UPI002F36110F
MNNIQTQHKKPNSVGVMNITESVHEIGASSVRTENSHLQETTDTQTVHPEAWNEEKTIERTDTEAARVVDIGVSEEQGCETSDVEVDVMDQSNQVLTGTGDETPDAGWTTDDTDVDDGQALALKGQLIGLTVLPSNEAITQIDSPVVRSQKDVSQEDSGWTDLSRSSLNTLGSSAVLPLGENEDQAKDDGSDEEDVIVDVLDSPDVPPFNLAGQQSVRIWANNEDELEEEDEVDVLM